MIVFPMYDSCPYMSAKYAEEMLSSKFKDLKYIFTLRITHSMVMWRPSGCHLKNDRNGKQVLENKK